MGSFSSLHLRKLLLSKRIAITPPQIQFWSHKKINTDNPVADTVKLASIQSYVKSDDIGFTHKQNPHLFIAIFLLIAKVILALLSNLR